MARGKKAAQTKHAKRRAIQRLGIPVGVDTLQRLVEQIQQGRAKPVPPEERARPSNRVSIHEVDLHGIPVYVYYDRLRKQIATIVNKEESIDGVSRSL